MAFDNELHIHADKKCIVWLPTCLCFPVLQNLLLSSTCLGLPGTNVASVVLDISVNAEL